MSRILHTVLIFMQLVFFLSCFTITFKNADPENPWIGASMFNYFADYLRHIEQGYVFLAGLMGIGIIAPIFVILALILLKSAMKYVYSGILIKISLLSLTHFFSKQLSWLFAYKMTGYFYTLIGSQVVSILCLTGIIVINRKMFAISRRQIP